MLNLRESCSHFPHGLLQHDKTIVINIFLYGPGNGNVSDLFYRERAKHEYLIFRVTISYSKWDLIDDIST